MRARFFIIMALILAPLNAYAEEPTLRVPVSEPLGTESAYYRITACGYVPALEPQRCPAKELLCTSEDDCPADCFKIRDDGSEEFQANKVVKICPEGKTCTGDNADKKIVKYVPKVVYYGTASPTGPTRFELVEFRLNNCNVVAEISAADTPNFLAKIKQFTGDSFDEPLTDCVTPKPKLRYPESEKPGDGAVYYKCEFIGIMEGNSGAELLSNYIGAIYRWGAGLVGIAAVLVIVIQGIRITAGGVEPSMVEDAKTRIMQSLIALILLFLSGLLLYTINPNFFTFGS